MIVRSTILILISQGSFLLTSFAINFGLSRIFGPKDYGTYGLIMSILLSVELLVITGIPEVVQKYGGQQPNAMADLKKKTLPWQLIYSLLLTGVFYGASTLIARVFNDESLIYYLKIASFDIFFAGMYRYYLGIQNGLQRFGKYTVLGISFAFGKMIAIFCLVGFGHSLTGALIGNVIGSIIGLLIGIATTKIPIKTEELDDFPFRQFVAQNVFYFVFLNLLFSIDLWFVKYYLSSLDVGYYTAAGMLGKVPYILSIAFSAVLLPYLSRAIQLKQQKRVNEIIFLSLRYILLFFILLNLVVIPNAKKILALLFGSEYVQGANALAVLMAGLSMVTFLAIINTIMIANHLMKRCFLLMFFLVIIDIIFNAILVPKFHIIGAASATTFTAIVGIILGLLFIRRDFDFFLFRISLIKMVCSAIGISFLFGFVPFSNLPFFFKSLFIILAYLSVLVIAKEINSHDFHRVRDSIFSL